MIVGTTQASKILNISTARLRVLLIEGRVKGAYKTGKMWLIPLHGGKPIIEKGSRGPSPRWRNPRKPAKIVIHVNKQQVQKNKNKQQPEPVITVKRGNTNQYGHEVEIPGGCRVIYSPDRPLSCGAKVWIETLYEVNVISFPL